MAVICINEDGTEHDFNNNFSQFVDVCIDVLDGLPVDVIRLDNGLFVEIKAIYSNVSLCFDEKQFFVKSLVSDYSRLIK